MRCYNRLLSDQSNLWLWPVNFGRSKAKVPIYNINKHHLFPGQLSTFPKKCNKNPFTTVQVFFFPNKHWLSHNFSLGSHLKPKILYWWSLRLICLSSMDFSSDLYIPALTNSQNEAIKCFLHYLCSPQTGNLGLPDCAPAITMKCLLLAI